MTMLSPASALAAVDAVRQHFATRLTAGLEPPAVAAELTRVLALLAEVDFSHADEKHLRASGHPVVTRLRSAGASSGGAATEAVLHAFLPHLNALPWRFSYEPREDTPDIGERMAWAELVGPIAPFHSHKVCLGLTAIGSGLLYPAHRHPAVETYLVVSGTAAWTAEGVTRDQPPGTLILHPSNAVHAMRTAYEPLLAAYAWTGDVGTLSEYVEA